MRGFNKTTKNILAVLLIAFLIYLVDVRELWGALSKLTWLVIGQLMLLSLVLIYISALKWKIFLEASGHSISVFRLFGLYLIGYFINQIAPSYVGGDVVRSWYLGKRVGQHEAFTATILERYTGLVAMLVLALVFVWVVDITTWEMRAAVILLALGLGVITWLSLSPRALARLARIPRLAPATKHLEKVQAGLTIATKDKSLMVKTMLLSFLFHTMTVVNTVVAAYGVGWFDPPLGDLFVVLPLILLIGSLPISPSGLGIQEGAFLFFLHALGASEAQALGVGVVLRAKSYVLGILGGLIWFFMSRFSASTPRAESRALRE